MKKIAILMSLLTSACTAAAPKPELPASPRPDMRQLILMHKSTLWKDPDSIKGAEIGPATRGDSFWSSCVKLNAKNSFGGYSGASTYIVMAHDDGRVTVFKNDFPCGSLAPFPELNGRAVRP